ncbi:MAG: head GIN domain-containing protein [Chitinophagaceae bacterium]
MYKASLIKVITILSCILIAAGCSKEFCFKKTGNIIIEKRILPSFSTIELYERINLILTQDDEQQVSVETGENLLSDISTNVTDGVLTIHDNNSCNWARNLDNRINVYITVPKLSRILYYGAGDISSTNTLKSYDFYMDSWTGIGSVHLNVDATNTYVTQRQNNADISITGNSYYTFVYCTEQGTIDLRGLNSMIVNVDHRSILPVYINASDSIDAHVFHTGNVYYKGHPSKINTLYTNSGRLIPMD